MGDYESGYDPKYGYNRNAFAHKTIPTAILGKIVKIIATPIGLASEAIHANKDKKHPSPKPDSPVAVVAIITRGLGSEQPTAGTESHDDGQDPVYVDLSPDQADKLIANGQAIPAEGQVATHEIVAEGENQEDIDGDEADWALDEAGETEEPPPPPYNENDVEETMENLIGNIQPAHGSVTPIQTQSKLPFPVVLPQRRPGTKTRGFVRAYAPVLHESGIDQEMFLSFLKNFHKAMQANPMFDVVMVATALAGAYPDPIVGLAVQAVQIAVGIGQEIQERLRLNKFLDQANKEIFMPRGLFALIVTYKPGNSDQPEVGAQTVDLGATAMAKYGNNLSQPETTNVREENQEKKKKMDEIKEKMKRLRVASGETHGEAEMPVTCAPLIFPALDAVAVAASQKDGDQNDGVTDNIKAKAKGSSKFVSNYFDRRAQAVYATNNPDSTLTTQASPVSPQFKSRYADPNNATNMHLFSLLTGGKWKAQPITQRTDIPFYVSRLGARRRYERAQRKEAEKRAQGIRTQPRKRLLSENVLYLMVVNMPTEQELEKARKEIQEAKERKAAAKRAAQHQQSVTS
ncbi:hypothetical protein MMC11_005004 [Xylographa trunciseda]|nr:hypothetical protein [Xylographa trunciseda]